MKIYMKIVHQYLAIFFNLPPTSNHPHPLQVENCDSNSRLVVDEDDNGKFRLESINRLSEDWYTYVYCVKNNSIGLSMLPMPV